MVISIERMKEKNKTFKSSSTWRSNISQWHWKGEGKNEKIKTFRSRKDVPMEPVKEEKQNFRWSCITGMIVIQCYLYGS